jgi:hypothetical protein
MTDAERRLLIELARAVATLPPGGRVGLHSAAWAVEEEMKARERTAKDDSQ